MSQAFWDDKFSTEEYIYTKEVNRFVKEHLANLTPGKMIDLAGGEGRNAVFFAEKGWQVENIDFSKVALEKFLRFATERNVSERAIATHSDATAFVSSLAPVDLGLIAYLQIAMVDLEKAITNLVEQIKPGGVFFGVWHARENLKDGFGGPQNPDVLPTVEIMRDILQAQPVEIEVLTNRDGQVQTREGLRPSITLTVLAKRIQ